VPLAERHGEGLVEGVESGTRLLAVTEDPGRDCPPNCFSRSTEADPEGLVVWSCWTAALAIMSKLPLRPPDAAVRQSLKFFGGGEGATGNGGPLTYCVVL